MFLYLYGIVMIEGKVLNGVVCPASPVHGPLLNLRRGRRETNQQPPMSGVLFGLLDDERNKCLEYFI
jgi:hypothetical protein